jgi:hypothetical protein
MGKMVIYLFILSAVLIALHFAGFMATTPSGFLVGLLNPGSIDKSPFFVQLVGILTLFGGAAVGIMVTVGSFTQFKPDLAVTILFTGYLISMVWDLIVLFTQISQINLFLATLVMSPLIILWLLTAIEWWRGKD